MSLLTIKIIALTIMGVFSLFFGLLPLRLRKVLARRSKKRERIVSCLLCFGGGVLLATVFTHMLPETREGFDAALPDVEYPLTEVVICAGFFLIYFIEEVMHKIFLRREPRAKRKVSKAVEAIEENNVTSACSTNHCINNNNSPCGNPGTREGDEENQESVQCSVYSVSGGSNGGVGGSARGIGGKAEWATKGVDNPVFAGDLDATAWNPTLKESILSSSQTTVTQPSTTGTATTEVLERPEKLGGSEAGDIGLGHGHSHLAISGLGSKGIASNLRSLLVIVALSFHSVFEGLAVGLQERTVDVWYLLGAISAHKFVIAFCMGLELLAGGTSAGLMVIYMVVFALVSPLGVVFGILVTENIATDTSNHLLTVTIMQGLAGGTILYVTFFEVLERERGRTGGRLLKFIFVLLGFGAMASLEAFGGHSHGHGHSHGGHGHSHGSVQSPTTTTTESITEGFDKPGDNNLQGHSHSHHGHSHSHHGHGHVH